MMTPGYPSPPPSNSGKTEPSSSPVKYPWAPPLIEVVACGPPPPYRSCTLPASPQRTPMHPT